MRFMLYAHTAKDSFAIKKSLINFVKNTQFKSFCHILNINRVREGKYFVCVNSTTALNINTLFIQQSSNYTLIK